MNCHYCGTSLASHYTNTEPMQSPKLILGDLPMSMRGKDRGEMLVRSPLCDECYKAIESLKQCCREIEVGKKPYVWTEEERNRKRRTTTYEAMERVSKARSIGKGVTCSECGSGHVGQAAVALDSRPTWFRCLDCFSYFRVEGRSG